MFGKMREGISSMFRNPEREEAERQARVAEQLGNLHKSLADLEAHTEIGGGYTPEDGIRRQRIINKIHDLDPKSEVE